MAGTVLTRPLDTKDMRYLLDVLHVNESAVESNSVHVVRNTDIHAFMSKEYRNLLSYGDVKMLHAFYDRMFVAWWLKDFDIRDYGYDVETGELLEYIPINPFQYGEPAFPYRLDGRSFTPDTICYLAPIPEYGMVMCKYLSVWFDVEKNLLTSLSNGMSNTFLFDIANIFGFLQERAEVSLRALCHMCNVVADGAMSQCELINSCKEELTNEIPRE